MLNCMDKNQFIEIIKNAKQLCREIMPQNQYAISQRNDTIISELVKIYGIDAELAKEIFENNNDIETLWSIYNNRYGCLDNKASAEKKNNEDDGMTSYVTEEIIYRVLNVLRDNPNAKASDFGLKRSLYNSSMEIISDENLAKGISIKYGGNGDVYMVLANNVRLTLAGIQFLDSRKQEPSVYPIDSDKSDSSISVFLSYSWDDSAVADEIETMLAAKDFLVHRDVRDIGSWQSIREFMKSIRKQDYVVTLISDKYLHSENCMYEVGQLLKDNDYKARLFPAIICDDIYNIEKQIEYVKYWEDKNKRLESQIERLSFANRASFTEAYRKSKEIETTIGDFLNTVVDMNNPKLTDVGKAIIEEIQKRENKRQGKNLNYES